MRVTELPIGYWTDDFKQHIENLMDVDKDKNGKPKKQKAIVKDYNDMSTDTKVDIEITFSESIDEKIEATNEYNNFEKTLKLYTSLSTNNMHLFNDEEKLMKFENEKSIVDSYYPVRLEYYQKRKTYMINALEKELKVLSNKANYIQEILEGSIDLRKKKKIEILSMLEQKQYDKMDDDMEYKYLVKMSMDSVSEENVERILKDRDNKNKELAILKNTTIENMWLTELEELKDYMNTPKKSIKIKKKIKIKIKIKIN